MKTKKITLCLSPRVIAELDKLVKENSKSLGREVTYSEVVNRHFFNVFGWDRAMLPKYRKRASNVKLANDISNNLLQYDLSILTPEELALYIEFDNTENQFGYLGMDPVRCDKIFEIFRKIGREI